MKAVRFSAPETVAIAEVSPRSVGAGEVMVAVDLCGICGTDLELFHGTMPYVQQGLSSYPLIPGHEWCGEVIAVGTGVSDTLIGQHIVGETVIGCGYCNFCQSGSPVLCPDRQEIGILGRAGALAEYTTVPVDSIHVIKAQVNHQDAALIEPLAVSLNAIRLMNIGPCDRVIIVGLGTIGAMTAAVAKLSGARITALDPNPARAVIAERVGCDDFWSQSEIPLAGQNSFTLSFETSGNPGALEQCLSAMEPGGRIGILGIAPIPEKISSMLIATKCLIMQGFIGSSKVWPEAIQLVETNRIRPADILDLQVSPLTAVPRIISEWDHGQNRGIKHLIHLRSTEV